MVGGDEQESTGAGKEKVTLLGVGGERDVSLDCGAHWSRIV